MNTEPLLANRRGWLMWHLPSLIMHGRCPRNQGKTKVPFFPNSWFSLGPVSLSSNCLHCQGHTISFILQRVRCFIMALRMVSSFRIQAVRATFLAFPASRRRW